jgi:hypothetical protein
MATPAPQCNRAVPAVEECGEKKTDDNKTAKKIASYDHQV